MRGTRQNTSAFILAAACGLCAFDAGAVQETGAHTQGHLQLASGQPARTIRTVSAQPPARMIHAYQRFRADVGGSWVASWDEATGVPLRIFGKGVAAPGSVASPDKALAFAKSFLARHLGLLAPGSSLSDLRFAANVLDGGTRVVAFTQSAGGMPVMGGQLALRFKNDRLFVIASQMVPRDPRVTAPPSIVGQAAARGLAEQWIAVEAASAHATLVEGPMVLPVIGARSVGRSHVVVRVTVESTQPLGKWHVYLDARTGKRVARQQTLRYASAALALDVPVRYPQAERKSYPARLMEIDVDGSKVNAGDDGTFAIPDAVTTKSTAFVRGPLVVVNNDSGDEATSAFDANPDDALLWSAADSPEIDSQLTSYVHAHIAKDHGKGIAPNMAWLNQKLPVNVNIADQCNAFYDGKSINFFKASQQCENTGRLADVVYHEFGHGFHHHAIIPGSGEFDSALSEGVSDYYACSITLDPAMGRGFFKDQKPLRHIDPSQGEYTWPDDIHSDPHQTGLIIGGALWDLRKLLVAKHGDEAGAELTNKLFYESLRHASDIPSMYPEVLAADDDDGDLENGTPNACEIIEAFGAHGLRTVNVSSATLGLESPAQDGYHVSIKVEGLFDQCDSDKVDGVTLRWRLRRNPNQLEKLAMEGGPVEFSADIPKQAAGEVVQYKVEVGLAGQSPLSFPDNKADPLYEFFVGEVIPLYCTDFETDPEIDGWTHGLLSGKQEEGADDWQWGVPNGTAANGDPAEAYSGLKIFGNDLGSGKFNGLYKGNKVNFALSPVVDTLGHDNVRLQYRRWLNVEDGYFDQANIYANDTKVWSNLASKFEENATVHHQDREWRFQDVDLSDHVNDSGTVQVKFQIASDQGLHFGGWSLDDLCIVAFEGPPPPEPVCGNAELEQGEECDDGNTAPGDGCSSLCRLEDPVDTDPIEETPTDKPTTISGGCGCHLVEPAGAAPWATIVLGLGLGLALRRRTRQP